MARRPLTSTLSRRPFLQLAATIALAGASDPVQCELRPHT